MNNRINDSNDICHSINDFLTDNILHGNNAFEILRALVIVLQHGLRETLGEDSALVNFTNLNHIRAALDLVLLRDEQEKENESIN